MMKTTVEISDSLLREVRKIAARDGVTLRVIIERGLHRIVAETKKDASFRLRRASFKGSGKQPEFEDATWNELRDLAYRGRGS